MAEPLRSTLGQFSSSGGRWQPRAQNVRAVEPAPDHPRADRGNLYILIEVTGAGGGHAALYRQMLNAAQTAFYEVGNTVEVALRQAVREVQSVLKNANVALPEARWRAGMTLVVRYGTQLVIAQAGPSLLLVSHPKTVDVFPERPEDVGPALGGPERPEVVIYDAAIEAGSMLLLAQSDWMEQVKLEALAVAAAAPTVVLATEYLGQLAGSADLSALIAAFDYGIPAVEEGGQAVRPQASGGLTGAKAIEGHQPPEEAGKPQGRGWLGGLFGRGRPLEEVEADEEAPPVEPEHDVVEPPERAERVTAPPPKQTPVVPVKAPPVAVHEPEPEPSMEEQLAAAEAEARQQAEWERRAAQRPAAAQLPPMLQEEPDLEVPPPPPVQRRSAWPIVLAAVIIPLLIVAVVVGMLFVRARAAEAQFAEKLDGARNILVQAEQAGDDATAAQRLAGAKEFLDQAKELRENDPQLAELVARYDGLVMRVEKVTPLYGIVPLWPFQPETGHSLQRVVVSGESVFVLDKARGEAWRFARSALGDSVTPADKPVVRKGDPAGDKFVGDLMDMAWVDAATANQRSLLHVLDATGELIGYDEVYGPKRLAINREKWTTPLLMAGYNGNLYVADPGANQIWRHVPTANGYEGEVVAWFEDAKKPDMANVVSMAIDGYIWLLYSDGRVLKFLSGEQSAFVWDGLPTPLSEPVAIAVSQEGDRLYIADPGNARIVEASKDGKFLRQFKAREGDLLRDVNHIYLDEAKGMFYLVTDDQMYKASVPQPGQQ